MSLHTVHKMARIKAHEMTLSLQARARIELLDQHLTTIDRALDCLTPYVTGPGHVSELHLSRVTFLVHQRETLDALRDKLIEMMRESEKKLNEIWVHASQHPELKPN